MRLALAFTYVQTVVPPSTTLVVKAVVRDDPDVAVRTHRDVDGLGISWFSPPQP